MPPTSDLVRDSRLRTKFYSNYTQHTYYVSGVTARQRTVKKEERWQRCGTLGSGAFGTIWLEKLVSDQGKTKQRAVKEVRKNTHRLNVIDYSRELEAIAKFSHEKYERCFVRSFGWYESGESVFIAMEYFPYGDLQEYLSEPLPEKEAQQIAFQILEGVAFMHNNGFAHRDLKPTNILVKSKGPDWWVKIGDFGISKRAEEGLTALRTLNGTPGFLAPEILLQLGLLDLDGFEVGDRYTVAIDIWSLGEITFRTLTGNQPFPIRCLGPYVKGNTSFPIEVLQSHGISNNGCDFVRSLMAPLPKDRLTAKDALSHAWIESQKPSSARSSPEIQSSAFSLQEDLASLNLLTTDSSACWSTIDDLGHQPSALAPLVSGRNTTVAVHPVQNSLSSSPNSISVRNQKIDEDTPNLELQVSQESYDDGLPWLNSHSTGKNASGTGSIMHGGEAATNEYSPAALSSPLESARFKEAPSLFPTDQVPLNEGGMTAHHSESQDSGRIPTSIGPRASWDGGDDVATSPTSKGRTDLPLNVRAAPYEKQEPGGLLIISPVRKELSRNATALSITMQAQTHNDMQGTTMSLITPTELTPKPLQSVSNLGESQVDNIAKNSDQLADANTFTPIITRPVSKDRNERVAREDEAITSVPSRHRPALSESNASGPAASVAATLLRRHSTSVVEALEKQDGQQYSPALQSTPSWLNEQQWTHRLKRIERRLKADREARPLDGSGARKRLEESNAEKEEPRVLLERKKERRGRVDDLIEDGQQYSPALQSTPSWLNEQQWTHRLKRIERRLKADREARPLDGSGARKRLGESNAGKEEPRVLLEKKKERRGRVDDLIEDGKQYSPALQSTPLQPSKQRWIGRLKELERRLKAEREARLLDRSGAKRLEESVQRVKS